MKNKIIITALLTYPIFADLSIGQMETMVSEIKAKRVGSIEYNTSNMPSPFVMIKIDENKTEVIADKSKKEIVQFRLSGIVNDKAYVNNRWIGIGDEIYGYKLSEIIDDGIVMIQDKHTIKVFLKKNRQILKLNEG